MMPPDVTLTPRAFAIHGQERFIYSGEIHYFRLPPERWPDVLLKAKDAGLNTVCTYIPWNWHEPEPGRFDFNGQSDARRSLIGFLDRVAEVGLALHFRPGPTIVSEWRHGGFPDWLLRDHPEVLALDAQGRAPDLDILYPPVTYLHPVFLEHVTRWYRSVLPVVLDHPVQLLAVQIDNELMYGWGLRTGDPLFIDYNPWVVGSEGEPGFYQRWLSEKYREIAELNRRYRSGYRDFAEIQPPRAPLAGMEELPWFMDWHFCKEEMANRYVEGLYDLLVELGVKVPLTMLSPYLTPYGVRRFADFFQQRGKPILVTTQCYPTLFGVGGYSEESSGHIAALMQVSRDWLAGSGLPFISAESQSAMSFHLPPGSMEAFYALQIGQGLAGINFYMMAGGENPAGFGMNTGSSYDVSAPIGHDGSLRPHFPVIQRNGEFLIAHGGRLLATEPLLDLAVGYYPPYETAALQGSTVKAGAQQEYAELLSQIFGLGTGAIARGSGVFSLLTAAGFNYAMLDLERTPFAQLRSYPQLWCLGLDFMARLVQEKLVAYVEGGGHLVLLPQVPHLDEAMRPCGLMKELLPAPVRRPQTSVPAGSRRTPWHLVRLGDVNGLPVSDTVETYDLTGIDGAEPCAYDERSGEPCGYSVGWGKGKATLLGFKPRYGWDNHGTHRSAIRAIAAWGDVVPHAMAEGGELVVIERLGGGSGFLHVINATHWPQTARIRYQDPGTGQPAFLPREIPGLYLPGQGGLILCLRASVPGMDLEVLYTTSQIQAWQANGEGAEILLYGPAGTLGEIALKGKPISSVSVDGEVPLGLKWDGELCIVTYRHSAGHTRLRVAGEPDSKVERSGSSAASAAGD